MMVRSIPRQLSVNDLEPVMSDLLDLQHELTPSFVPVQSSLPAALEFMRQVHTNFPVVYRGAALNWPALVSTSGRRWAKQYLLDKLKDTIVTVAETPLGNADAPLEGMFVQPHTSHLPFPVFVDKLLDPNADSVCYMQSQNNNMPTEFPQLANDIQVDIPWATEALQSQPEAVNLWIGSSRSTTSLHKDPYENLHVQILGQKVFKLVSPAEHICVKESMLKKATYQKSSAGFNLIAESGTQPWPTLDPDGIDCEDHWQCKVRVLEATLNPGDMLYLPALWYHKVTQVSDMEGLCCSVNYWYDMDFTGPLWPFANFVRGITDLLTGDKHNADIGDSVEDDNCVDTA
ncbi:phospholipase A2 [Lipomyces kononenkoae]|uniref:Phospholipase A2 n=1 Tax=Lipomyces kononenkoae TaxID=34357 RepID=A0ACC3TB58_LIPKO